MAQPITKMTNQFRRQFILNKRILNWFPGHMVKGIKKINRMLHKIDCIIEIHDARVPFTGRNTKFQKQLAETRPHYLILNKMDLCDPSLNERVEKKIIEMERIEKITFTNLKTNNQIRRVLPDVLRMVDKSERYQRTDKSEINILVTGIPNVGKSSFINQILNYYVKGKGAVAKKGAQPGVTRTVQEKIKLSSSPLVYIYDTPGILEPIFENPVIDPLKLAACDLLSINRIGVEDIADYLLFWLNKHEQFSYVEQLKLDEPIDQVDEFLTKVCLQNNFFIKRMDTASKCLIICSDKIRSVDKGLQQAVNQLIISLFKPLAKQGVLKPNFDQAAITFIKLFQKNKLGNFTLDTDKL